MHFIRGMERGWCIKMRMRKKIILFFILLVALPVFIIYSVALAIFTNNHKQDLQVLYTNNIGAIGRNVDRYFVDALDLSIYPIMESELRIFLTTPEDSGGFFAATENANNILSSTSYGASNGVRSVTLANLEGTTIAAGLAIPITLTEILVAQNMDARPYWYDPVTAPSEQQVSRYPNYIFLIRLLKNPSNISQPIGIVKIAVSKQELGSTILAGRLEEASSYHLIDETGRLLLSTGVEEDYAQLEDELTYEQLSALAAGHSTLSLEGGYFVSAHHVERTGFILYSVAKPNIVAVIQETLVGGLSIAAALTLVFSIILAFGFSKIITAPLERLGKNMQSISNQDFSVRSPDGGKDEIAILSSNFNHMADRLDVLYNQVYLGQLKLKQAELNALQMQINPHFLYNTLDTIYWMSELGDSSHVSRMVSNLSQMLRISLTPDNDETVLLSQEIKHLECYIGIQQIRYGEKITFTIDCAPALYDCLVLKLLLQPLVENALLHGLNNSVKGTVLIRIFRSGDSVVYDVMNDGTPIDVPEIDALLQNPESGMKGFALRNIYDRIQLKNGKDYTMTYFIEDGFSVFRVTQKYVTGDNTPAPHKP